MFCDLIQFCSRVRIWNLDETSLSLDPGAVKVVGERVKPATHTTSTSGRKHYHTSHDEYCRRKGTSINYLQGAVYVGPMVCSKGYRIPEHRICSIKKWLDGE
jgi:hypothetical protein